MKTLLRDLRKLLLVRFLQSLSSRRRRIVAWELMSGMDVDLVRFTRDGLTWNIRLLPYDDISWYLFVDGGFQIAEIQALLAWARHMGVFSGSRNIVIDAGANIGTTCIPMVHTIGCRALAIEPVAANFSLLRRNVESNALTDKVLLANKAVAMRPGRVRMCLTDTSGGHFLTSDQPGANVAGIPGRSVDGYEYVEADTLSGIVAAASLDAGEIALVWADVQGCELAVIESGSDFWVRGVPLFAEIEPHSLRRQGTFDIFAAATGAHFDRFIEARDLTRPGAAAVPRPIAELGNVVAGITPAQINTNVLLLPPAFSGG